MRWPPRTRQTIWSWAGLITTVKTNSTFLLIACFTACLHELHGPTFWYHSGLPSPPSFLPTSTRPCRTLPGLWTEWMTRVRQSVHQGLNSKWRPGKSGKMDDDPLWPPECWLLLQVLVLRYCAVLYIHGRMFHSQKKKGFIQNECDAFLTIHRFTSF